MSLQNNVFIATKLLSSFPQIIFHFDPDKKKNPNLPLFDIYLQGEKMSFIATLQESWH